MDFLFKRGAALKILENDLNWIMAAPKYFHLLLSQHFPIYRFVERYMVKHVLLIELQSAF